MLERIKYYTKHTKCKTYFTITGSFNVDDVTSILNLKPYESWNINDSRKTGAGNYTFSRWSYGLCEDYNVETYKMMEETLQDLFDKKEELQRIKDEFEDIYFGLVVVPTVKDDESVPTLSPSMEIMKWCAETETNIDYDLYVSTSEKEIDDYTMTI